MPARVEGYPWALSFGSEQHGFSLSQMYRNLLDIESPVLLVIETTNNEVMSDNQKESMCRIFLYFDI